MLRRSMPLGAYYVVMIAVFIAVALVSALYIHVQTRDDAQDAAHKHARFAAHVAAKELSGDMSLLRLTVANLAANPAIATVFTDPKARAACTLSTTGGHVDIVAGDGTVACSSRKALDGRRYSAAWFVQSQLRPTTTAPIRDPENGRWSVAVGTPIKGSKGGVVMGVFDLEVLAPDLLAKYSGGEPFLFVLTDGKRILARSTLAHEFINKPLLKFAPRPDFYSARDRQGVDRFFAQEAVPGVPGWRFVAGERQSAAIAPGAALERRQFGIILVGLVLMLAATMVAYRRIVGPIDRMRVALRTGDGLIVPVDGPKEVTALGRDLNAMLERTERERQQQKLEALGRLAAGVAHDFNGLLMVIGTQAARILRRPALDAAVRESVAKIDKAATRGSALTGQLVALSRTHALNPVPTSVNDAATEMLGMLDRVIGSQIETRMELSDDDPLIMIDEGELAQVLLNLAINARDAMPSGGRITIRTRVVDVDEEDMTPGRYVQLEVEDDGVGMNAETRDRLFEPFFTTKDEGTGLGLATVHSIVLGAGGVIDVESDVGSGTVIRIRFPDAADERIIAAVTQAGGGA